MGVPPNHPFEGFPRTKPSSYWGTPGYPDLWSLASAGLHQSTGLLPELLRSLGTWGPWEHDKNQWT